MFDGARAGHFETGRVKAVLDPVRANVPAGSDGHGQPGPPFPRNNKSASPFRCFNSWQELIGRK